MAAPLRHALSGCVWLAMAVICSLPLIPAGVVLITPAFSVASWQSLLNDPQLPRAFIATLVSTLIATASSLFIALGLVTALWPGKRWQQLNAAAVDAGHSSRCLRHQRLTCFCEGGLFYQYVTFYRRSRTARVSDWD